MYIKIGNFCHRNSAGKGLNLVKCYNTTISEKWTIGKLSNNTTTGCTMHTGQNSSFPLSPTFTSRMHFSWIQFPQPHRTHSSPLSDRISSSYVTPHSQHSQLSSDEILLFSTNLLPEPVLSSVLGPLLVFLFVLPLGWDSAFLFFAFSSAIFSFSFFLSLSSFLRYFSSASFLFFSSFSCNIFSPSLFVKTRLPVTLSPLLWVLGVCGTYCTTNFEILPGGLENEDAPQELWLVEMVGVVTLGKTAVESLLSGASELWVLTLKVIVLMAERESY